MEIMLYKKIFQIMQTANDDEDNEAVDDANDKKNTDYKILSIWKLQ